MRFCQAPQESYLWGTQGEGPGGGGDCWSQGLLGKSYQELRVLVTPQAVISARTCLTGPVLVSGPPQAAWPNEVILRQPYCGVALQNCQHFQLGGGGGKYFLTVAVFQEHRAQGKFNMCSCHYSIPFQWLLACLGFMCSWRQESPHQAMKPQKNNDHHHDVSKFVLSGLNTSWKGLDLPVICQHCMMVYKSQSSDHLWEPHFSLWTPMSMYAIKTMFLSLICLLSVNSWDQPLNLRGEREEEFSSPTLSPVGCPPVSYTSLSFPVSTCDERVNERLLAFLLLIFPCQSNLQDPSLRTWEGRGKQFVFFIINLTDDSYYILNVSILSAKEQTWE